MHVKILGAHNCESKDFKLASLLIDDVLAIDAGALTSSLSFHEQQKLKAILLTHQHYDHIKDIPLIAMGALLHETTVNIYAAQVVYDALTTHLMNGKLYPDFLKKPQDSPAVRFTLMEPGKTENIGGYSIMAVPVNHSVQTLGYQVTSPDGKAMFYTGDTGLGLADCWKSISPRLLIIEVTAPNEYEAFAREMGHFTPSLLKQELNSFRELKGYLPQVVTIHMNPLQEKAIKAEIDAVAKSLNAPITLAHEGMLIHL